MTSYFFFPASVWEIVKIRCPYCNNSTKKNMINASIVEAKGIHNILVKVQPAV